MSSETNQPPIKAIKKRAKMSMERVMVLFTLFFFAGILLLVVIPEDHPVRGVAMTLYSIAVFWSVFRFGV